MSPDERQTRVRAICEQMCEQPLDEATLRELEALLLGDAAAQAIYLRYVQLDTQLGLEFGGRHVGAVRKSPAAASEHTKTTVAPARHVGWRFGRRHRLAAATVAIACSLLLMFWWTFEREVPRRAGSLAYLSDDARWASQNAPPLVGDVLITGDYALETGAARIALDDGAMLHITGPSRWSLVGSNDVRIAAGALNAFVPRSATGFSVEIPGATLIDRGTAFAVNVEPNGVSQIHVEEGQVDVTPQHGEQSRSLAGGDAIRFDADSNQLARIAFDPSLFPEGQELRITSHPGDGKVLATGKVDTREWPNHRILRVGMGGRAPLRSGCAMIYLFELPAIPNGWLLDAKLSFHYVGPQDSEPHARGPKLHEMSVDLVSLGVRNEPVIRGKDYSDGQRENSNAVLIQRDLVTASTSAGVIEVSAEGQRRLIRHLREHVYRNDGSPKGRYLVLRLNPSIRMPQGRYEIRGFIFSESEASHAGDQPPQLELTVAAPID